MSRGRESISHWTREGTFLIEQVYVGGSWMLRLWHEKDQNKTDLGLYFSLLAAAQSISSGMHDQKLGFAASALGVPLAVKDWNRR